MIVTYDPLAPSSGTLNYLFLQCIWDSVKYLIAEMVGVVETGEGQTNSVFWSYTFSTCISNKTS